MTKQVIWTETTLANFIRYANLSEDEIFIMTTRAKEWTITKQAMEMHRSASSIARAVKRLKAKYDVAQREHPDELPQRKESAVELYMDTH